MKINVKNKKENMLLSRIEIDAELDFRGMPTPSEQDVKKALSKEFNVEEHLIVIKKIATFNGRGEAVVNAHQYISREERDRLEPLLVRKEAEARKKAEEQKKKEAGSETKEEKKETEEPEKKTEEKTEEKTENKKEEKPAEKKEGNPGKEEKKKS
ncbi:hypothetical protein GF323_04905 [Candidatus Woesearchaeota archaeon]|nr:hypothetical protein [Candidatus Woesearchaeota archaeon]